jgi:hypothetical protein
MNMYLKWSHFETMALLNFTMFEDSGLSSIPFAFVVIVQMYCLIPYKSSHESVYFLCNADAVAS